MLKAEVVEIKMKKPGDNNQMDFIKPLPNMTNADVTRLFCPGDEIKTPTLQITFSFIGEVSNKPTGCSVLIPNIIVNVPEQNSIDESIAIAFKTLVSLGYELIDSEKQPEQ